MAPSLFPFAHFHSGFIKAFSFWFWLWFWYRFQVGFRQMHSINQSSHGVKAKGENQTAGQKTWRGLKEARK